MEHLYAVSNSLWLISSILFFAGLQKSPGFIWLSSLEKRWVTPLKLVYNITWLKSWHLFCLTLLTGGVVLIAIFQMTGHRLLSGIGFVTGCLAVVVLIELLIQKIIRDQEASLSLMFGLLKRWAAIHPDLIQCLARVCDEPLSPALKAALKRLLLSVQHGIPLEKAFDDFTLALDLPLFRDFMIHLKFSARSRGDLVKLFDSFERESYRLQMERAQNRTVNQKYKMTIWTLNGIAVSAFAAMVSRQSQIRMFYLESRVGQNFTFGFALSILIITWMMVFSEPAGGKKR